MPLPERRITFPFSIPDSRSITISALFILFSLPEPTVWHVEPLVANKKLAGAKPESPG